MSRAGRIRHSAIELRDLLAQRGELTVELFLALAQLGRALIELLGIREQIDLEIRNYDVARRILEQQRER